VLTKGLVGVLIPAATLAAYAVWQRDTAILGRLNLARGLTLFAAIVAPWFVLAARANAEFLRFFFIREHFQRFLTPIEHRTEPFWFFAAVLAGGILPWLPQALAALGAGWRAPPSRDFDARRLLWIWSVFVVVFFSFSDSKLIPYILPAVPALALLCAGARGEPRTPLIAGALLSAVAAAAVLAFGAGAWHSAGEAALVLQLRAVLPWTGAALFAAAAVSAALALRGRPAAALGAQCAGWIFAAMTLLAAARAAEDLYSGRELGLALRGAAPVTAPVFSVRCYGQALTFYSRRLSVLVDYRDEFDLGLRQNPSRGIASLGEFSARWRTLDSGFAVMPFATREELKAAGLPMRELARSPDRVLVSRR
jgi:4-amino-4-deoxy-L-arabinose transferase-like glycosyltransferase